MLDLLYSSSWTCLYLGYYNKAVRKVVSLDDEDVPSLLSTSNLAFGHKEQEAEGSGDEIADFQSTIWAD